MESQQELTRKRTTTGKLQNTGNNGIPEVDSSRQKHSYKDPMPTKKINW
jgi:hypothetical protein